MLPVCAIPVLPIGDTGLFFRLLARSRSRPGAPPLPLREAPAGVYHASGRSLLSRFEFAQRLAECFGFDKDLISPCKTGEINQATARPLQSGFVLDKVAGIPGVHLMELPEQLAQYKKEREQQLDA